MSQNRNQGVTHLDHVRLPIQSLSPQPHFRFTPENPTQAIVVLIRQIYPRMTVSGL
jgi:hypothetical protein